MPSINRIAQSHRRQPLTESVLTRVSWAWIAGTAVVIVTFVSGCAPVATKPFDSFTSSVQELRTGADEPLEQLEDHTKERFLREAPTDPAKIQALLLTQVQGDPFGWKADAPILFLQAVNFRQGVYRLNTALIDYSMLLAEVASPVTIGDDQFQKNADDLNSNVRSALAALNVNASNNEVAIFSTAAMGLTQSYLRSQQRKDLIEAIKANQQGVQDVSALGASAVVTIAQAVRSEYDLESADLARQIASGGSQSVADLVALNERFVKEMSALRILHHAYEVLPMAHAELAEGLQNDKITLASIRELYDSGRDLCQLYQTLKKAAPPQ